MTSGQAREEPLRPDVSKQHRASLGLTWMAGSSKGCGPVTCLAQAMAGECLPPPHKLRPASKGGEQGTKSESCLLGRLWGQGWQSGAERMMDGKGQLGPFTKEAQGEAGAVGETHREGS